MLGACDTRNAVLVSSIHTKTIKFQGKHGRKLTEPAEKCEKPATVSEIQPQPCEESRFVYESKSVKAVAANVVSTYRVRILAEPSLDEQAVYFLPAQPKGN